MTIIKDAITFYVPCKEFFIIHSLYMSSESMILWSSLQLCDEMDMKHYNRDQDVHEKAGQIIC